MEKVKLYDGTELEIVDVSEGEGTLYLFFQNVNLDEIRAALSEPNNLSFIQVITEGGAFCRAFEGYGEVEEYNTTENVITGESVISVRIVKLNKVLEKIKELEEQNKVLTEAVDYLLLSKLEESEVGTDV